MIFSARGVSAVARPRPAPPSLAPHLPTLTCPPRSHILIVTPPFVTLRMLNPTVGIVSSRNDPVVSAPTSDDLPAFCSPTSDSSISRRKKRLGFFCWFFGVCGLGGGAQGALGQGARARATERDVRVWPGRRQHDALGVARVVRPRGFRRRLCVRRRCCCGRKGTPTASARRVNLAFVRHRAASAGCRGRHPRVLVAVPDAACSPPQPVQQALDHGVHGCRSCLAPSRPLLQVPCGKGSRGVRGARAQTASSLFWCRESFGICARARSQDVGNPVCWQC